MKQALMGITAGVEVEFNGHTDTVATILGDEGWCFPERHDYHCRCETCSYATGLLWRYQRDSSVTGGEFITRIVSDWPEMRLATDRLENGIVEANQRIKLDYGDDSLQVNVGQNTGLHVHVGQGLVDWPKMVLAYLRYERYIQHLGAGPFADKREGMNLTMLNAVREQLRQLGHDPKAGRKLDWARVSSFCQQQVAADRHVDLNYSTRNRTYEFRVFNSTTAAWQMELAARLAVAFTKFAANSRLGEEQFILPAPSLATMVPKITLDKFVSMLCKYDADLRPLIERKMAESAALELPDVPEVVDDDEFELEPLSPPGSIWEPPTNRRNATVMRNAGYAWNEYDQTWRWVGRANVPPEEPVAVEPRLRVEDVSAQDDPDDPDDVRTHRIVFNENLGRYEYTPIAAQSLRTMRPRRTTTSTF